MRVRRARRLGKAKRSDQPTGLRLISEAGPPQNPCWGSPQPSGCNWSPYPVATAARLDDQVEPPADRLHAGPGRRRGGRGLLRLRGYPRSLGRGRVAVPGTDERRHGDRRPGRRRGALPAARPRALLRPARAHALLLHRGPGPRSAAPGAFDQRGEHHPLVALVRRPSDPRRRRPRDGRRRGLAGAVRPARAVRTAPLGRGRRDAPVVGPGSGALRQPSRGRTLHPALDAPVRRLGLHEVGPHRRHLRGDGAARPPRGARPRLGLDVRPEPDHAARRRGSPG